MMEIFDVVNEADEVIGQATRDECHANPELIHRVVQFTLFDLQAQAILLTRRALTKSTDPWKWCFPGEHVLSGESYGQAVGRGFDEELGFKASDSSEMLWKVFRSTSQTELARFFVATWSGQELGYDEKEISELRWIRIAGVKKNVDLDFSDMAKYWIGAVSWCRLLATNT